MTPARRRLRTVPGERGQAVVEFALIAIPFFLLLMGIFDFGRGILAYNMISNAAREAARVGVLGPADEDVCERAVDATELPGVPADHTCTASGTFPQAGPPSDLQVEARYLTATDEGNIPVVEVTVTYDFHLVMPLIGAITGDPITMRASSKMYVERPPAGPLPTTTPAGPTATAVPPTATTGGPTATAVPPTATTGGPTATPTGAAPTATPTATQTPGPSATPTSTPVPPSPTATSTPAPCFVPTLIGKRANNAPGEWSNAGFTTTVVKNGSGNFVIGAQSLPAGSAQSCTQATITISP